MTRKSRPREHLYLTAVVCLWLYEESGLRLGYAQSAPARAVVEIGDEKITSNDLESFAAGLPVEPAAARASRLQQVQSLIAMRLFARAARAEKLDNDAEFLQAEVRMRAVVLIYAFYRRTVQPKLSEEAARKYFDSHKEELQDFTFSRNRIHSLLRDQALNATNEALMQEWEVHRDDEALRMLDLRNIKNPGPVLARIGSTAVTAGDLLQYIGGAALERITEFPAKKLWLDGLILERLYPECRGKSGSGEGSQRTTLSALGGGSVSGLKI